MQHAARPTPSTSPSVSVSASAAAQLSVRPGQTLLVCLPPGASLVVQEGCLALRSGPIVWGQVVTSQADLGVLEAGQCRTAVAGSGTEWMELSNPGHTTARAVLTEPVPVLSPLVGLLRACLARVVRALRAQGGPGLGTSGNGQQVG